MELTSQVEALQPQAPPAARPTPVYLQAGQIYVAELPTRISIIVGSCVAVLLWSPQTSIGGAAHYLLPQWKGEGEASPRYGNVALAALLKEMQRLGAPLRDLRASLYGGASILESLRNIGGGLGTQNVQAASEWLRSNPQIKLCEQKTGGKKGRKVSFDTFAGTTILYEIG